MKKFKALAVCAITAICAAATAGCTDLSGGNGGSGNGGGSGSGSGGTNITELTALKFKDNSNPNTGVFNNELYYRNDLKLDMGDPMVVYDDGVFYAAGTRGATSFEFFKSTDLTNWEAMGSDTGFTPRTASVLKKSLWAPDIQKIGDKWYMYYTAGYDNPNGKTYCQIGVAVADEPYGKYQQWTGTNADGKKVGISDLQFQNFGDSRYPDLSKVTILDQHVFQDDDGELYMYFSLDASYHWDSSQVKNVADIYGVKMKDPVTWDLSTLTRLISPGYKTLDGTQDDIPWETWSESFSGDQECTEGPYMIKHNGKYILTYCANSFVDTVYGVGYAVSDSPLGTYVKPDDTFLQNLICGVPGKSGDYVNSRYLGFMTGTGHASICKVGDEYLIAYHAHMNRDRWGQLENLYPGKSEWRALGFDYLYFDSNGLPYSNGPTYSLQRLPEAVSGYKNLAAQATVSIDGKTNAYCTYINDNFTNRAYVPDTYTGAHEENKEAQFSKGKHTITLKFAKPVTIKGVNVYNSYDYNKRTEVIESITFGTVGIVKNVQFNKSYIHTQENTSFSGTFTSMFPHSAYNVELESEVVTDTVTVTIECDRDFAIGEIEILGK